MNVTHLECAACGLRHEARRLHNLCTQCGKPLLVRYDLKRAAASLTKESLADREPDLWRAAWTESALHQRRGPESDSEFQSAGYGRGRFDGQRIGRDETRGAIGR